MNINRIPAKTFYWLKMNDASVHADPIRAEGVFTAENTDALEGRTERAPVLPAIETGMGPDAALLYDGAAIPVRYYRFAKNTESPVRFRFDYPNETAAFNLFEFDVPDDCDVTVVMTVAAARESVGAAGAQVKFRIGKRAVARFAQVQTLGDGFDFYNDIGVVCDDGGRFELTQLVLGGGDTYIGARTALAGDGASLTTDIGYLVGGNERLDMNYAAVHTGKRTACDINASGVLRENAYKLFRGTIDFKNGASGSVGNEKEDVMLMDDEIVNKTIPIILCEEEDVEGNHGATIGRLDDELIFYLESRGINADDIYEMLAKARMTAVAAKIADKETRDAVIRYLGEDDPDDQ